MTELSVRLDKLRFLAEELQLAFALANSAPDAWNARPIARHILIRAYDVIAHARQIRKFVRTFGSNQKFHEAKEAYASWFDEYFKMARHKLGAHVQDLDFGQRIELWNDIETSKIGTFVEGAAEIYGLLAPLNLPGYVQVTAVSGSGPAYLFHFIEALCTAGMEAGLDENLALLLAKQTVFGAAKLAIEASDGPSTLREQVTSPNGTTAAALSVLMDEATGLRSLMIKAVHAAKQRSVELGQ